MEPSHPSIHPDSVACTGRKSDFVVPAFVDGNDVTFSSTFPVVSPYTGSTAWHSASASPADALSAVEAASATFPAWAATKPSRRRDILLRAAQLLEDGLEDCATIMRTEMGADRGASSGFIVPLGIAMLRDCAARISAIQGAVPTVDLEGQTAMVLKEPIGVVLGIVPWNAPFVFGCRSIGSALAAGCTTVIKASEMTPRSYYRIARAFADAGLPAGVLNVVSCRPEDAAAVTRAMIEHAAVRKVNFTGSTTVGRQVAALCGQQLKPCLMELGGKNSSVVLADADLNKAATQCALGGFLNAGQICMATDRVIVHRKVASEFMQALKGVMEAIFDRNNPPPTLVSHASRRRVLDILEDARSQGAMTLQGGWEGNGDISASTNGATGCSKDGVWLRPVIVNGAKPGMRVWEEEMFSSVIALATAESDEEAVQLANSTGYGLSAAVFTEDLKRGLRVAKRLESGAVHINTMTVHDEPALPFGGVKASGWGRFNSAQGLDEFLVTKSVTWMDD